MLKISKFILLSPLALLYYLISEARNLAFNIGLFKINRIEPPVISVGNLSTGGTGKTPFTMALIELLSNQFNHIVVISRGYGRRSKGPRVVSLKGNIKSTVNESGDEPYMIANRYSSISVVVAEKRIEGYELIKNESPDLVVLDDAFQHRSMHRDLDIVLMNGNYPYNKDFLLPIGRLREVNRRLNRADCLVVTKNNTDVNYSLPTFALSPIKSVIRGELDRDKSVYLVSGIANPNEFEASINDLGIPFKHHLKFNDHYSYKTSDFTFLNTNDTVVTTEKDYFKVKPLIAKGALLYLEQKMTLPSELIGFIQTSLDG